MYKVKPSFQVPTLSSGMGTEHGVHDSMRFGLKSQATELTPAHPLELVCKDQDRVDAELHAQLTRDNFGLGAALRLKMDTQLVGLPLFGTLGASILNGSDTSIDVHDIFKEHSDQTIQQKMEARLGLQ